MGGSKERGQRRESGRSEEGLRMVGWNRVRDVRGEVGREGGKSEGGVRMARFKGIRKVRRGERD